MCWVWLQSVGAHRVEAVDEYNGHTVFRIMASTVDKREPTDFAVLQTYDLHAMCVHVFVRPDALVSPCTAQLPPV